MGHYNSIINPHTVYFGNTFVNSMELNDLNFLIWWKANIGLLTHFKTTKPDHYMKTQSFYIQVYRISGMSYTGLSLHRSWDVVFILAVTGNIKHEGF